MSNILTEPYKSIDSINPKHWGKSGWNFLNSIALTYKPEYKENYKLFFSQLQYILPCYECGLDIKNSMHSLDDALKSKESLLLWLLKIFDFIFVNFRLKLLSEPSIFIFTRFLKIRFLHFDNGKYISLELKK